MNTQKLLICQSAVTLALKRGSPATRYGLIQTGPLAVVTALQSWWASIQGRTRAR